RRLGAATPSAVSASNQIQSSRRLAAPMIRPTLLLLLAAALASSVSAQAPPGPVAPQPGVTPQSPPPQAAVKVRVALVTTPATVRDAKGEMIHDLEASDFRVTDNGVPQRIAHFDLGGDPLSFVVVVETSSRVEQMLPQIRKSGIVIAQTIVAATGEAAVLAFNDDVQKLQDFTANGDAIQKAVNTMKTGTSGTKLYDAMAQGVEMLTSRPEPTADSPGRRRILLVIGEATDEGSDSKLGEVLRQAQLANVTIYSVGLSTTRAEWQAKPRDTTPQVTPPGVTGRPNFPGSAPTPDNNAALYGTGNLIEALKWALTHVKDAAKDNPLQIATMGTGGAHL